MEDADTTSHNSDVGHPSLPAPSTPWMKALETTAAFVDVFCPFLPCLASRLSRGHIKPISEGPAIQTERSFAGCVGVPELPWPGLLRVRFTAGLEPS